MPRNAKINQKMVDVWTPIHFISGFIIALVLSIILRNIPLVLLSGSIIVVMWEAFEYRLKKYYDVFNVPFGHKTVYESQINSIVDLIAGELGVLFFVFCIFLA